MLYLAGIFDAEGCVSLCPNGVQIIEISICHEKTPDLFKSVFGGNIYHYKREKRKDVFCWRLNANLIPRFIQNIEPFSITKKSQLQLLAKYIDQRREERRNTRSDFVYKIAACKRPPFADIASLRVPTILSPSEDFFKWLAGFFDGDGNFCCFEYRDPRSTSGRPMFASTLSCFNAMPDTIRFVKERLEGSISVLKQNKNPVWKWVCARHNLIFVLKSLYPHLRIKQECCRLMIEFMEIFNSRKRQPIGKQTGLCKKGGWGHPLFEYTNEETSRLRDIIKEIKFHNSL